MSRWAPASARVGELGAVQAPRWRRFWSVAVGVVLLALGSTAILRIADDARTGGAMPAVVAATIVPLFLLALAGLLLISSAVANRTAEIRLKRLVADELGPDEVVRFVGVIRTPSTPPRDDRDLLGDWRARGLRGGALVCTPQRLFVASPRAGAHPVLAWPRDKITSVGGSVQSGRALLSIEFGSQGLLEVWLASEGELGQAQAALAEGEE